MNVYVCVGSSCHLKGSYEIIEFLKKYIEENNLLGSIELKAAFCLGRCTNGVTIKVNDEIITGVNIDNVKNIADEYILNKQ